MAYLRQTYTLIRKDLLIVVWRRWLSTFLRAAALPIAFMFFISYVRNFFLPPSEYGIGVARPIRDLTTDILNNPEVNLGGRDRIAFVNNGFQGGAIETVINSLSSDLSQAGFDVRVLTNDQELFQVCRSSLSGGSACYAAATFQSSPNEGSGGVWSYLARADFSLGQRIFITRDNNDAQIYALPFVQAVDRAIAAQMGRPYPDQMNELPFTDETVQERDDDIQRFYMGALTNYLAVAFFIGICGIAYHLPGHVSSERESGMSQLIDAMIARRKQWVTQSARLLAAHVSFDLVYLPGWISMGAILASLVFQRTSAAIVIFFHILTGLSLTGYALFGAVFFRKSQLSGITVLIISLVLAIIAQFALNNPTANLALSILFPSITYTRFMIYLARFERQLRAANLLESSPYAFWQGYATNFQSAQPAGYLYFVFLAVQAVVYPLLALLVEWLLYGTSSRSRHLAKRGLGDNLSIELRNFSKHYRPGSACFGTRKTFKAVDNLSFEALKGQVLVLLGANGSGKSTTLNAISGVESITKGSIDIDGTGGLGLCPQKNVLWDELTVFEHVKIFNRLKSLQGLDSKFQIQELVDSCDLYSKMKKKAKTLSGGQKRKLQLAMAYTGGSKVCCIDEVSSGLDPLSRRKIWQILTSQKGKRTFLLTTHALDEADALSDNILLLSKGHLKAGGTAAELKHRYGGNYDVLVKGSIPNDIFPVLQASRTLTNDGIMFHVRSEDLQPFLSNLGRHNITEYQVAGPTIENVFLNLATEIEEDLPRENSPLGNGHLPHKGPMVRSTSEQSLSDVGKNGFHLTKGRGTSFMKQTWILFAKRLRILTRNYLPYICAIIIPLMTAGLTTLFLAGFNGLTCEVTANYNDPDVINLAGLDVQVPVAPAGSFSANDLPAAYRAYANRVIQEPNYPAWMSYIQEHFRSVNPGGLYLANNTAPPLMAYRANDGIYYAALAKTAFDSFLMGTVLVSSFSTFALPISSSTGDSLQLVMYIGFAMCAYPAFFALYPTFERLKNIRALHYSNGIRGPSLWLAYTLFDTVFVVIISVVAIIILTQLSDVWYESGYLFVVFLLYGIASTLLSYIVSLYSVSQLAAFAFSAGGQAVFLLIYFILYMVLITFSQADGLYSNLNVVQFTYGLITPSGNLLRALLLTLNQSQLVCRNQGYVSYPGDITVYGGPIFYLVLQIFAFYTFLVLHDRGLNPWLLFLRRIKPPVRDSEKDAISVDSDVTAEMVRTERSDDGLRVLHLSKHFGREHAVEDVTFGVSHGEVFALLGPNGAGKSTTISLIRGSLRPSDRMSDILIEGISTRSGKVAFRRNLGVCPQFDAIDRMTVTEHLRFYARAAGVPDVKHNVSQLIRAVGLEPFKTRMAAKLSGGNQRKLSLAIAIIGDPSIVLLDEPSSGMDAVTKRVMWKVLKSVKGGRSLVITTHSMEEVSALADRAGIMAKRMLAVGTTSSLQMKHGNAYHVQLVHENGPRTTEAQSQRVAEWVQDNFPRAIAENIMLHGQFKFAVPKMMELSDGSSTNAAAIILRRLEECKADLGIKYYSFGETTLEDVFLNIVGKHRVEEEEQRQRYM